METYSSESYINLIMNILHPHDLHYKPQDVDGLVVGGGKGREGRDLSTYEHVLITIW